MPPPQIIISLRQGNLREVFVVTWETESTEPATLTVSHGDNVLHAHVQRAVVQPLHHVIGLIEAALAAGESADPLECPAASFPGMSIRERATVVAALRWWQESVVQDSTLPTSFPQLDDLHGLSPDESNCLCNRLTTTDELAYQHLVDLQRV